MPGMPTLVPTKVEVKMIDPPPRSSMAGICERAPRKALVRFVVMVSCHSCRVTSPSGL